MAWKHIRGHDFVVRSFQIAVKNQRLGHAYLFVGPRGVGKRLFAQELAKALLCEGNSSELAACDRCPACLLVNAETHPDLFFAKRPEEVVEFPISVIRELTESLAMKAARGKRKVVILDDADSMNDAAANAFLKTLEEPPPGTILILIGGSSAELQLPTIISRCRVIRFSPLAAPILRSVLADQGITDATQQDRLMHLSGGSPGLALALQNAELWEFRENLLQALCRKPFNSVATGREWIRFLEELGKEAGSLRRNASLVLCLLMGILEGALRSSLGLENPQPSSNEARLLKELGERLGSDRILEWMERTTEADYQIDRMVPVPLMVEALMNNG